ncbi:thioredoxin 2 [Tubulinosema ratisbonensis]|uniref:Thioredoxin 2 n=1 Tax=Tubulinosema ratisbonensis TaxID=291195 RepID=A0A437AP65_9MICR|nr:thioredoxin 2 [Tubulinosema ratisbonensis]
MALEVIELQEPNDIKKIERKNKILKFYTVYCGPCKQLTKELENYSLDLDVTIISINGMNHRDLCAQYSITAVPVLIFLDESNNVLEKFIGGCTIESFQEMVKKHFMNKETN